MAVTSDRALWGTKDGRVVGDGDPDAWTQLASRAGKPLPDAMRAAWPVEKYMRDHPLQPDAPVTPTEDEEEKKRPAPANKALKPDANK